MYGFETTNVTQGGAQVYTTYLLTNHVPVMLGGGGYALNDSKSPYTRARRRVPPAPLSMARGIEQVGLEGLGLDRMEALLVEALRGRRDLDDGVQRYGDIDALLAPQPREVGIQHSQDGLVAGQWARKCVERQ